MARCPARGGLTAGFFRTVPGLPGRRPFSASTIIIRLLIRHRLPGYIIGKAYTIPNIFYYIFLTNARAFYRKHLCGRLTKIIITATISIPGHYCLRCRTRGVFCASFLPYFYSFLFPYFLPKFKKPQSIKGNSRSSCGTDSAKQMKAPAPLRFRHKHLSFASCFGASACWPTAAGASPALSAKTGAGTFINMDASTSAESILRIFFMFDSYPCARCAAVTWGLVPQAFSQLCTLILAAFGYSIGYLPGYMSFFQIRHVPKGTHPTAPSGR